MAILLNWLLTALVIMSITYILPGVSVANFYTALAVALVLGVINALIKPVLLLLTLPINILTLGLFTFVINGFLVLLTARIVHGFSVEGFWSAVLFSLLLSLANSIFHHLSKTR